jgi:hypothetical protein
MAGRTKISVSVIFIESRPKPAPWAELQKEAKKPGDLIFGSARLAIHGPSLGMEWDTHENEATGKVTVAVKSLTIVLECTTDIRIFSGVKKGSKCMKHLLAHEAKHIKLFKKSIQRSERRIESAFKSSKYPDMKKPHELDSVAAAHAHVTRWIGLLHDLHREQMDKAKKDADKLSDKIHTSLEGRRTSKLCLEFEP